MKVDKKSLLIIFAILFLIVSFMVFISKIMSGDDDLLYSGIVEAREADIAFQLTGRISAIYADEGARVEKGQEIMSLDPAEFEARLDQAKASLASSVKEMEQITVELEVAKSVLPSDVKRAEAGVDALKANLKELETGYRPQDVEKGRLAMLSAETAMQIALRDKERAESLFKDKIISEKDLDNATLLYDSRLRGYEQAKENYTQLVEGYRKENVEAARAGVKEGEAKLNQASKSLEKINALEKQVEAASARVKANEAALKLAEIQLSYSILKAPFSGVITGRNVELGEVVSSGREVISMADLSMVDLKIYVDEKSIGRVKHGQDVDVKVDTFPDKIYKGRVAFISPDAEFTPKIIQTHKERVKLVYLVKVKLPNPEWELKTGMPADAWIR
ncbi:MAG: HlyD family efflux transporter periplasmic adaptor subunit [Desulfatiglans sp.]|jgi:HlyD family secretion protein|nr:HlyD family efflux transporter periplasmic adaptor subunit [Desulfatiglans sp.]